MTVTAGSPASDGSIDFFTLAMSAEFHDDPYPWYHRLRSSDPVHETPFGVWLLTRHADVAAAVRDPRLSHDPRNAAAHRAHDRGPTGRDAIDEGVMLFVDPPDHTRLRGLVSRAFTPRRTEQLRSRVAELVDDLLDAAATRGDGRIDVVDDLAYPLPLVVICELLGVPAADHAVFQGWSQVLAASIDPAALKTPEQEATAAATGAEFSAYFVDLIEQRRGSPGDDLLSALIAAEQDGDRLSQVELVNTALFLLVAGHETTVNLIGNGLLALLHHRDQLDRLRADRSLDRPAVDELLRYESPVQNTQRITLAEHRIGDVVIPAGMRVVPMLGAANRDPAAFADPDRLDLGRPEAGRHVAFGGGPHYCLGASLARLEGEIAIGTVVRRFPELDLAGEPERRQTFTLRGLAHLPVALGPDRRPSSGPSASPASATP
jgi:cytochrome P450